MYLEEFLTDYRASLLRKCKALMKVLIIALAKKAHDRLADIVSKEGHVIAVKTRGGEILVRFKVCVLSKKKDR